MKREVKDWTIDQLFKERDTLSWPEYQRQPNLWSLKDNSLLIDSILQGIDIPKLYFNRISQGYEVVDGQQRLWAIWKFLDDDYKIPSGDKRKLFSELSNTDRKIILNYTLQVVIYKDAKDEFLRDVFLRLQLGLLLVAGERLNASSGVMKKLVFDRIADHGFIKKLPIPPKRFAKETLAAHICINSITRAQSGVFSRTRYEDLNQFFTKYKEPHGADMKLINDAENTIIDTMTHLEKCLGSKLKGVRNRSYILSIYLLFEELLRGGDLDEKKNVKSFGDFVIELWKRLREETKAGMDRRNRELYLFHSLVSSAPGEKYQIERRHEKMAEYFEYYKRYNKIKGD